MNRSTQGFVVLQPGMLTLIQDMGRFGHHGIGLTNGGPLDPLAFRVANKLCGNTDNSTALEVSIGGLVFESQLKTAIAVTGADMPLTINGQSKELWRSHPIKAGDKVELGYSQQGCRSYLAVVGGFDIAQSFDSTATVTRESIGGLKGEKLQAGDVLSCSEQTLSQHQLLAEQDRPSYQNEITLRVITGYQQASFSLLQQRMFFSSEFEVSDRCDRMGYRLTGPEIISSIDGILSEGICHGAIQIPADGQPIVLMNDRQTIGGYPKIGSVISIDTARLAQLLPGGKVSFEHVSIERAHNLLHWSEAIFQRARFLSC